VITGLGLLQGGEAYVTFKPNLVDDQCNIGDESPRKFLQGFPRSIRLLFGRAFAAAGRALGSVTAVTLLPSAALTPPLARSV
jgi:hypothetical protein